MRRFFQRVLTCLLSVGMIVGLGGVTAFAAETGDAGIQTLALEPDDWTADGYQPYHGFTHGDLQISGVEEDETIEIEAGESVVLTIEPFAHVQYKGCNVGSLCCLEHCEDTCWIVGKGCVCNGTQSSQARLRLVEVSVTTDADDIISCETECDYSAFEAVGDMTEGSLILTGQRNGTVTVTVKAALYDWVDAETTFTIVVTGAEDPETEEPGDDDPGIVEPGPEEPDDEEPGEENPNDEDPGVVEPGPEEPDDEEPGEENPNDDDPGIVEPGPEEPDDEEPGEENPNDDDPGIVEPGPAEPDDGGSGTDNPEPGNGKTGLIKGDDNKWGYYVNGIVDTSYTGFASNANGDWYVVNGYVLFDQNSVYKDTTGLIGDKGIWYYVVGSKVQHDFVGLANYKNANGWWYINKGKVDFNASGVYKNNNGWYYVNGGKVDFNHNGVDKNANGWWYVVGGKVQFGYTGVANYKNANGWWYIKGGKVDFSANTVAKNNNGWWYVKGGKVDFSFKGIASNQNGTWYLSGGKVQFGYSGPVTFGGKTYTVKKGKVN